MTGRGFPEADYRSRTARAQGAMQAAGLDALLLTTAADIQYLSGFLTRFWESPTRPWYLVLPASGLPVAVIPRIGAALMRQSWLRDIRTWNAPDPEDDGVSLLADTLAELVPGGGAIGVPGGPETRLHMPLRDWQRLRERLPRHRFIGGGGVMRRLRMIKSAAEIARIAAACSVADRTFARLPEIARPGAPLSDVFRRFQMLCLDEGADWVPYLAGAAGPDGYADVISPATERPLAAGDVLMLDTGLVREGYFCDFNRNVSLGPAGPALRGAHARLIEATAAGFDRARPGATAADLFTAMDRVLTGGRSIKQAGRLGHGLGLQLTEPPSLLPSDRTPLEPGMVLTLEPVIDLGAGRILVHEEDIVIRETGAEWLSSPYAAAMPELA
ncbi:M24 family metallopeptidase [Frigidibacter sp. ROC022]|uniref:M24 family metallopeptidase n=1 Tax=Frigidibacter sp. ROC022 TaxID=2971796 RepID=UPI00215A1D40|nr:Xaa-Pro peptidase family protein [Frigidibacter sp. ROC022]